MTPPRPRSQCWSRLRQPLNCCAIGY
jgi:hypothetical protein